MSATERKSIQSLKEAFEALPERTRSHSERVGEYMRIIFLAAINEGLYVSDPKASVRLREEYADLVYTIGLYHDVGKVFLPDTIQFKSDCTTAEEEALWRSQVTHGLNLIEEFFRADVGCGAKEKEFADEAIGSMHENFGGDGFPDGLSGRKIPLMARLLKIANDFDLLSVSLRSERPFDDALAQMSENPGGAYDAEVLAQLKPNSPRLRKVFKTATDTKIIPAIDYIVKRTRRRPVRLTWRQIEDKNGKLAGAEAVAQFTFDEKDCSYDTVEYLFRKDKKLGYDLCVYLTAEACDLLRRSDAAGLGIGYAVLNLPGSFLRTRGSRREIISLLSDSELEPARLIVNVDASAFTGSDVALAENVAKLREAGVRVMLSGAKFAKAPEAPAEEAEKKDKKEKNKPEPGVFDPKFPAETGFTDLRFGPADAEALDTDEYVALAVEAAKGLGVIAEGLDAPEVAPALGLLNPVGFCGGKCGGYKTEDKFIEAVAAAENA